MRLGKNGRFIWRIGVALIISFLFVSFVLSWGYIAADAALVAGLAGLTPTAAPPATPSPVPPPPSPGTIVSYARGWNIVAGPAGTAFPQANPILYTSQTGGYTAVLNTQGVTQGWGYWAYFASEATVTMNGAGADSYTTTLEPGQFKLVGNPSGTKSARVSAGVIWAYDPAGGYTRHQGSATIPVGRGAWVHSAQGGTVTVTATDISTPTPTPAATATPAPTATATLPPTATPTATPPALSLIDVHNHLPRGLTLENLIKSMDEAHVAKTVLMTVYYGANNPQGQGISDENLVLAFYQKWPDRVIPFLGMQRPTLLNPTRWQEPDAAAENLLRFAESQLRTGFFRGMGEFILWHYPYLFPSGAQGGTVKIPADTPLMKRFLDLAAKYHVPVTIHYEIDTESLPALRRMLDYGRQTTIILAHNCGRPDPPTLKDLLDKYQNVLCDLGGMNRSGGYGAVSEPSGGSTWFVKNPLDDGTGRLRPEWKALFEQYADRIVGIGADGAHPEFWANLENYKRHISQFRGLLAGLSPEAAEKIGFKNAQKLLVPVQ